MSENNQKSLKEAINLMVETYRLKGGITQARINQKWEQMMGSLISSHTKEIKIINHTLYISVDSAPLRQELLIAREKLIERINDELGENTVKELVVK